MNYQVAYFEGASMRLQAQVFSKHDSAIEFFKKATKSSDTCIMIRGDEVIMQESADPATLTKLV